MPEAARCWRPIPGERRLRCEHPRAAGKPERDQLAVIADGGAVLQGGSDICRQEQDIVLVLGGIGSTFASAGPVQVFGMIVTSQLDTTHNPVVWQIPGRGTLPPRSRRLADRRERSHAGSDRGVARTGTITCRGPWAQPVSDVLTLVTPRTIAWSLARAAQRAVWLRPQSGTTANCSGGT